MKGQVCVRSAAWRGKHVAVGVSGDIVSERTHELSGRGGRSSHVMGGEAQTCTRVVSAKLWKQKSADLDSAKFGQALHR
jgi:hypothetical protein